MAKADIIADLTHKFGKGAFKPIPGRGNSTVGIWESDKHYFIKIYPQDVNWNRRVAEQQAIEYYLLHGITVIPQLLHSHAILNYSVFDYIDGTLHYDVTASVFDQVVKFLHQIVALPVTGNACSDAKEAFFDTVTLKTHIDQRLAYLKTIDDPMLQNYLHDRISQCLVDINYHNFPDYSCADKVIISPSDFGTHNSLLTQDQRLYFIDFEYAGRDSLFKLLGDIYWHPGSTLSTEQRLALVNAYLRTPEDRQIYGAVRLLMGVKWSLLLLNEFIPFNLQKRIKASGDARADAQKIKHEQLIKSNHVLKQVYNDWRNCI